MLVCTPRLDMLTNQLVAMAPTDAGCRHRCLVMATDLLVVSRQAHVGQINQVMMSVWLKEGGWMHEAVSNMERAPLYVFHHCKRFLGYLVCLLQHHRPTTLACTVENEILNDAAAQWLSQCLLTLLYTWHTHAFSTYCLLACMPS